MYQGLDDWRESTTGSTMDRCGHRRCRSASTVFVAPVPFLARDVNLHLILEYLEGMKNTTIPYVSKYGIGVLYLDRHASPYRSALKRRLL